MDESKEKASITYTEEKNILWSPFYSLCTIVLHFLDIVGFACIFLVFSGRQEYSNNPVRGNIRHHSPSDDESSSSTNVPLLRGISRLVSGFQFIVV